MADWQNPAYSIDLVLVIDATASMSHLIESVKSRALSFHEDLTAHIIKSGRTIDSLRVRAIAFRDFYVDKAAESLVASEFFDLPDERAGFAEFVRGIRASGGGDAPETGLEGLATAIRSPWAGAGAEQRQVIVLWTDAPAHPLEKNSGAKPAGYPADMPASLDELTGLWDRDANHVHPAWKRLLLIAPDVHPWSYLADSWDATAHYPSQAGQGLRDTDYESVLAAIAEAAQDSAWPARKNRTRPAEPAEPTEPAAPTEPTEPAASPPSDTTAGTAAEPASTGARSHRGARWPWRRAR